MQRVSQLNRLEKCLKFMTGMITGPLGFVSVRPNFNYVIFRYGKFDRLLEPGFRWVTTSRLFLYISL